MRSVLNIIEKKFVWKTIDRKLVPVACIIKLVTVVNYDASYDRNRGVAYYDVSVVNYDKIGKKLRR